MRDANEVEQLQTKLIAEAAEHEFEDTFQYGLMCGKLYALSWIEGKLSTGAMCVNETFEDYVREQAIDRRELNGPFDTEED